MRDENVNGTEEVLEQEVDEKTDVAYEEQEIEKDAHEEEHQTTEEASVDFDFDSLIPLKSEGSNNRIGDAGVMSIINSKKNGRRVTFAQMVLKALSYPKALKLSVNQDSIVIGEDLPIDNTFEIKKYGAKGVIYSASLVEELTNFFELDFSDRVSITFQDVKYTERNQKKVAIISVK